jgi:hypothetical protein
METIYLLIGVVLIISFIIYNNKNIGNTEKNNSTCNRVCKNDVCDIKCS